MDTRFIRKAHIARDNPADQAFIDQAHAEAIDKLRSSSTWLLVWVDDNDGDGPSVESLTGGSGKLGEFVALSAAARRVATAIDELVADQVAAYREEHSDEAA